MYHRMTRHTVAFVMALAVMFGLGLGEKTASAAQGMENRQTAASAAEKLEELVKAARKYSGCGAKPLLERPSCYREFADKGLRVGVGVGVAAYAIHHLHKDNTQHFAGLRKELAGFKELKEAVKQDPSSITDPTLRAQAEKRIHAAWNAPERTSTTGSRRSTRPSRRSSPSPKSPSPSFRSSSRWPSSSAIQISRTRPKASGLASRAWARISTRSTPASAR